MNPFIVNMIIIMIFHDFGCHAKQRETETERWKLADEHNSLESIFDGTQLVQVEVKQPQNKCWKCAKQKKTTRQNIQLVLV